MTYEKRDLSIIDSIIVNMVEKLGFEFKLLNKSANVALVEFNHHVEIYYIRNQFVPNIDLHFLAGDSDDNVEVVKCEELLELVDYMKLRVPMIKGEQK